MNDSNFSCKYQDPEGFTCDSKANESGYCFWHDKSADKSGDEVKSKLEEHAKSGGQLRGIHLSRANLEGVNLVNYGHKTGFDLSYSDLYHADLRGGHLFNINLSHASLMKADLRGANLNCAQLHQSNLLGVRWKSAKVENCSFAKKIRQHTLAEKCIKENQSIQAQDYFEQAEEIYRDLRKHAEQEGIFTQSGHFIQQELTMRRMQMPKYSLQRITSKLVDLFCGYGEDPLRIILLSILIILFCAVLYSMTGLNYQGETYLIQSTNDLARNIHIFLSCLYYSVVTFTTLGYGDFTPVGISRAIAACEAFTGSFTIALFVVVFVKKMTR